MRNSMVLVVALAAAVAGGAAVAAAPDLVAKDDPAKVKEARDKYRAAFEPGSFETLFAGEVIADLLELRRG